MAHLRQTIRENIETALTGLTTTGSNVFASRVYPISTAKLPGLAIYTKSEDVSYLTIGADRTIERTLTLTVEAYVAGVANYDDTIDTIAAEVEVALVADRTRGGNALDTRLVSIDIDFSGDGETPVAQAVMQIEIDYITLESNPTTPA